MRMRDFLKVLLVIAIIAVVCVGGYGLYCYMGDKKPANSVDNSSNVSNKVQNSVDNNYKNEVETVENAVVEDEEKKDENKKDEEESNVVEETNLSDDDKAIDLAKKYYGTTDGVYFRIEQMQSNSVYIISVRDNETTRDLAWYTVDVKNGTVK